MNGIVAQLVEQRTENPCVGGSKPSDTTERTCLWQVFFIAIVARPQQSYSRNVGLDCRGFTCD